MPTLTAVSISPSTVNIDGAGSQAFTATVTGDASDVIYAWSLTGDTANASLSSSSTNPTTVTTTNDTSGLLHNITVNVSATSTSAGVSSGITDTSTIALHHYQALGTGNGVLSAYGTEIIWESDTMLSISTLEGELENLGAEVTLYGPYIPVTHAPYQRWTK